MHVLKFLRARICVLIGTKIQENSALCDIWLVNQTNGFSGPLSSHKQNRETLFILKIKASPWWYPTQPATSHASLPVVPEPFFIFRTSFSHSFRWLIDLSVCSFCVSTMLLYSPWWVMGEQKWGKTGTWFSSLLLKSQGLTHSKFL